MMTTKERVELADKLARDVIELASKRGIPPHELAVIFALAQRFVQITIFDHPKDIPRAVMEADTIFKAMVELH